MSSILEFIDKGKLGPISLGISIEMIKAYLGEPIDISLKRNPIMYKYGPIELAFYYNIINKESLLDYIHVYFWKKDRKFPKNLNLKGWIPKRNTSFEKLNDYLNHNGVVIKKSARFTDDMEQVSYISNCGVRLIFEIKKGKPFLSSIHCSVFDKQEARLKGYE